MLSFIQSKRLRPASPEKLMTYAELHKPKVLLTELWDLSRQVVVDEPSDLYLPRRLFCTTDRLSGSADASQDLVD